MSMHPEMNLQIAQLRVAELTGRRRRATSSTPFVVDRHPRVLPSAPRPARRAPSAHRPPSSSSHLPGRSATPAVTTSVSPDRSASGLPTAAAVGSRGAAAADPSLRRVLMPSSVDAVLSGRVGMSPIMIGRARPFARLAGIVDAADVMTSEQPAVALVSGEPGIGKTRLVRELVESLPTRITTIGIIAQPGSMGRPLDAVTGLVDPALTGDDLATAVSDLVGEAVAKGPTVLVIEDLHWIDTASANLIDRIAQQPWPNLVIIATYRPNDLSRGQPGGELVLRLERRHSVEQVRLDRLDRTEVGAMVAAIADGDRSRSRRRRSSRPSTGAAPGSRSSSRS